MIEGIYLGMILKGMKKIPLGDDDNDVEVKDRGRKAVFLFLSFVCDGKSVDLGKNKK